MSLYFGSFPSAQSLKSLTSQKLALNHWTLVLHWPSHLCAAYCGTWTLSKNPLFDEMCLDNDEFEHVIIKIIRANPLLYDIG
jgi:hypothetical protein